MSEKESVEDSNTIEDRNTKGRDKHLCMIDNMHSGC